VHWQAQLKQAKDDIAATQRANTAAVAQVKLEASHQTQLALAECEQRTADATRAMERVQVLERTRARMKAHLVAVQEEREKLRGVLRRGHSALVTSERTRAQELDAAVRKERQDRRRRHLLWRSRVMRVHRTWQACWNLRRKADTRVAGAVAHVVRQAVMCQVESWCAGLPPCLASHQAPPPDEHSASLPLAPCVDEGASSLSVGGGETSDVNSPPRDWVSTMLAAVRAEVSAVASVVALDNPGALAAPEVSSGTAPKGGRSAPVIDSDSNSDSDTNNDDSMEDGLGEVVRCPSLLWQEGVWHLPHTFGEGDAGRMESTDGAVAPQRQLTTGHAKAAGTGVDVGLVPVAASIAKACGTAVDDACARMVECAKREVQRQRELLTMHGREEADRLRRECQAQLADADASAKAELASVVASHEGKLKEAMQLAQSEVGCCGELRCTPSPAPACVGCVNVGWGLRALFFFGAGGAAHGCVQVTSACGS